VDFVRTKGSLDVSPETILRKNFRKWNPNIFLLGVIGGIAAGILVEYINTLKEMSVINDR